MAATDSALQRLGIDAFRAAVDPSYQTGSKLRALVTEEPDVMAQSYRWSVAGTTDTRSRGSAQEIVPDDAGSATPTAYLESMESFNYNDIQDLAITNARWMAQEGTLRGKAVGRKHDGLIIGALAQWDPNAYILPGLVEANMTLETGTIGKIGSADMAEAVSRLMDNAVGDDAEDDCTFVFPARQFVNLTQDDKLVSMDYLEQGQGTDNVTRTAIFRTIYGCRVIFIDQKARRMNHGRLADNQWFCFAKSAVGLATGTTERLGIVEWVVHRQSWLIGARANAGATRLQNAGVIMGTIKKA